MSYTSPFLEITCLISLFLFLLIAKEVEVFKYYFIYEIES